MKVHHVGFTILQHRRQTSVLSAGFEPAIPASDRPQTDALDRAPTTGIGWTAIYFNLFSDFHPAVNCYINEIKLSVNHSYLSLDLYLFILFNYIDFGDMFRHQVPSSGQYYVMTIYPYNAMHMLISLWDSTTLSLLQYWNYLNNSN
jgi:hypothetical protein